MFIQRLAQYSVLTVFALFACNAHADDGAKPRDEAGARYTFSWPLDGSHLKPRGGSTKGAPVSLATAPSDAWKALQADDISSLERDRRAIRAMAGTYRVTFDFLEVVPFDVQSKPVAPYQSWGTEKIYVDRDEENFISLVHILEMRFVQEDGSLSEPMVTKHWRQDWEYQPTHIVEHTGRDQWRRRNLDAKETRGAWVQTVYQVDESPRYASLGRWDHTDSYSTWISGETWRPLPRREWSVRDDYQALIGTNRHTILPTGWVQEENNLKAVLTDARQLAADQPFRAREYGVARYEAITGMKFDAADDYYRKTRAFWNEVRDAWTEAFAATPVVTLRGSVDKLGLFRPLFAAADEIAAGTATLTPETERRIDAALRDMGAIK
jgi:hypothetical protein